MKAGSRTTGPEWMEPLASWSRFPYSYGRLLPSAWPQRLLGRGDFMGLTVSHQLFHMDPHSWWDNNKNPTTTGLRCCQDVGGPSVEGTVCQGRGGSMERRPGGARSFYLLHRVSEKPSSLCKEKAEPQVGFQSPSASTSGLGELMFCWWTQRSESLRCSVPARLHLARSWAKLIKAAVMGQGPD